MALELTPKHQVGRRNSHCLILFHLPRAVA